MKKLKVVHIVSRFDIGGLENGIVNIATGWTVPGLSRLFAV